VNGVEHLVVPSTFAPASESHRVPEVAAALAKRRVSIIDFHTDSPSERIHLTVAVPILGLGIDGRPLGVLLLRVDPSKYLYPFIRSWPEPSQTAETLLIRRDGNDVLFLNELRFRKDAALSLRLPVSDQRVTAAKAVLGEQGIVEGVDYRDVPVIAAVGAVPESPWFMVVRMDIADVHGPLEAHLWMMAITITALLIGAGAGFGLLWRRLAFRFYRERHLVAEALERSERELRERNDELTRFTYTVSHDLKSPLVTIQTFIGYLEKDLEKNDKDVVEKDFNYIRAAAVKMSRLVNELLQLSRIGRKVNPPEVMPIKSVVEEAEVLVAGRMAERRVELRVTERTVYLYGDRERLVEVFQNLLDNAIKFMGRSDRSLDRDRRGVER
jgi:signal transduction histidine kinase